MPVVGKGIEEIRIWDVSGTYRVISARLVVAVYVLHAFQKKTQRTPQHEIDVAEARFNELMRESK